jgi:hypothetical protein
MKDMREFGKAQKEQSKPTNGGNVYHQLAEMCTIKWQQRALGDTHKMIICRILPVSHIVMHENAQDLKKFIEFVE